VFEHARELPLFQGFSDIDLAHLASSVGEQHLAAGEVLFSQGEAGYTCYIVLEGQLEALARQGELEIQLEICQPGQMIGEMAVIDSSTRSATVRAISASRVAVLDQPAFVDLMYRNPARMLDLLRSSTARLRRTSQHMIDDMAARNAELAQAYHELQAAQSERIRLSRIDEELAVARRIQALFLPRDVPQPDGWQIAAYNRGALEVGGDFFDCIPLPGGSLGLVIADVCGKGVPGALFVALTRSLVRASSLAPWALQRAKTHDLGALMAGALEFTNDYIVAEHGASGLFITLFYGILDPVSGHLSYVNAGHNAPLLLAADGTLRAELAGASLPLGIVPGLVFGVQHAQIAPGDTLVCYTDGITEAMDGENAMFDDDRLLAALHQYAGLPASDLVHRVVELVDAHVGTAPQSDDLTLLVLKRAP
jgi:serine phosphatase RsbU (regulator of sigma subunit)